MLKIGNEDMTKLRGDLSAIRLLEPDISVVISDSSIDVYSDKRRETLVHSEPVGLDHGASLKAALQKALAEVKK